MKLTNKLLVIYDDEGCEGRIGDLISEINSFLNRCIDIRMISLQDWDNEDSDITSPVVYIASLETEEFHSKIKPSFLSGLSESLLVLAYSDESEMYIKSLESNVKRVMKKREPIVEVRKRKVQQMLANIVTVNAIDKISLWWPYVLRFVRSLQSVSGSLDSAKREIGVFFKIDHENGKQFEWYEKQKNMLETLFRVQCRASGGGNLSEDIYIQSSKVVVMYVDRSSYKDLIGSEQQREGKRRMLDSVKQTRATCASYDTKFHLFINEAGVKFTNIINETGMKMVGNGMFCHLVEILSLLGKLRVKKRKQERVFYSGNNDRVERDVFNPDGYPGLKIRNAKTPRLGHTRAASMGDILMTSHWLQDVCYQPFTTSVTDNDGPPLVTCVSCFQRFKRR